MWVIQNSQKQSSTNGRNSAARIVLFLYVKGHIVEDEQGIFNQREENLKEEIFTHSLKNIDMDFK
jgi:hypothetical protein